VRIDFAELFLPHFKHIETTNFCLRQMNDLVLELPENLKIFNSKLGKQTKRHIKQYKTRINKKIGEIKFEIQVGNSINPEMFKKIVTFNRELMLQRGIISYLDKRSEEILHKFIKLHGFICLLKINDHVVAGAICSSVGQNFVLNVLARDIRYNKYDVGSLCLFNTIEYCINLKGQSIHFLYGTSDYKHRFLCQDKEVFKVFIFRNSLWKLFGFYILLDKIYSDFTPFSNLLFNKLSSNRNLKNPIFKIRLEISKGRIYLKDKLIMNY
jgi:hypothetical protein